MRKLCVAICALLVIMLIIGCAAPKEEVAEKEEVKEEAEEPEVAVEEKETEAAEETGDEITGAAAAETESPPAPTESKTTVEQSKELSPELKELLEKADRKLQSMTYLYAGPSTENRFLNTYLVKGNKIKIDLYEVDIYKLEDYFDAVYMDTEAKTATGRCEEKKRCISHNLDNTKRIFAVNYGDYRIKTPYEWIKEVEFAEIVGPEVLDGRSVLKIKYFDDTSETALWVDEAYGIPLKVEVKYDAGTKDTHQFKDFHANSLSDADVTPAFTEPLD